MIITFGGSPGSGKSTMATRLAKALGYRRFYMGQLFRDAAKKHGMTMHEFGQYCEIHPEMDRKVDAYQAKLGTRYKDLVVEGRTSYHFIPHAVKIYLYAVTRVGAQRIYEDLKKNTTRNEVREVKSLASLERSVKRRIVSERRRYQKWFGINPFLKSNYDLYVDTTKLDKEKVYAKIVSFLATKGLQVPAKRPSKR